MRPGGTGIDANDRIGDRVELGDDGLDENGGP